MAFQSHELSVQNQNVIGQSLLQISKFRSSTVYSNQNQSHSSMISQQNIFLLVVEFEIWLAYVAFFPLINADGWNAAVDLHKLQVIHQTLPSPLH